MGIHIRYGIETDAAILAGFQVKMAEETENLQLDEEQVAEGVLQIIKDRSKGFYLVAENDNEDLEGCLIITYEWSDWRNGWIWWIGSLYVDQASRKRGIFKKMLNKVIEFSRQHNVKVLRLYMDENNEQARAAYLKSGFKFSNYQVFEFEQMPVPGETISE